MQISDLIKPIEQMTTAELHEHIRAMRHRREVIRPARQAIIDRAEKKTARAKTVKVAAKVSAMSDEERLKLIELLGGTS